MTKLSNQIYSALVAMDERAAAELSKQIVETPPDFRFDNAMRDAARVTMSAMIESLSGYDNGLHQIPFEEFAELVRFTTRMPAFHEVFYDRNPACKPKTKGGK